MDESVGPPRRPSAAPGDADRLEALEEQIRQLTSRLAGWVEDQLVQALEDRHNDMTALRSELQMVVNEQLAGMRAESTSMLSVATRRFDVAHEQLRQRLETVAGRAAEAATSATVLTSSTSTDAERVEILERRLEEGLARITEQVEARLDASHDHQRAELEALRAEVQASTAQHRDSAARPVAVADGLEQRIRAAMSRLSESVEARLGDVAASRRAELDALRAEVATTAAAVGERVDGVARQATVAAEAAAAVRAEVAAATGRTEAFEERVKSAMRRLTESVETGVGEAANARQAELDALRGEVNKALARQSAEIRTEITTAATALRARFTQAQERLDALETQQRGAEGGVAQLVEAKLAEVVDRRRAELDAVKAQLQDSLAKQLSEARDEIGTAVANAHRRFVLAVEQLDGRMTGVAEQATAVASAVEVLNETVRSDGGRIEALEVHTRRTDAHLTDLVEAKLAEVVEPRLGGPYETPTGLQEALSAQLQGARTEIAAAVADANRRFLAAVERLDERMHALAEQTAATVHRVQRLDDTIGSEAARVESLERQARRVDARLRELAEARNAQLAELRSALDAHAAEVRAEVGGAVSDGRRQLMAVAARLEERQADLDHAAGAVAGLMEGARAEVEPVARQVAEIRAELAATVSSLTRRSARSQDQLRSSVESLAQRVEGLVKAAATESGALAPLRSDLHVLRGQVAELAEVVSDLRPRRRATAAAGSRGRVAPVRKAVAPSKAAKAPAPVKARKPAAASKAAKAPKAAGAAVRRPPTQ